MKNLFIIGGLMFVLVACGTREDSESESDNNQIIIKYPDGTIKIECKCNSQTSVECKHVCSDEPNQKQQQTIIINNNIPPQITIPQQQQPEPQQQQPQPQQPRIRVDVSSNSTSVSRSSSSSSSSANTWPNCYREPNCT